MRGSYEAHPKKPPDEGEDGAAAGILLYLGAVRRTALGGGSQNGGAGDGPGRGFIRRSDLRRSGVWRGAAAPAVQESICKKQ